MDGVNPFSVQASTWSTWPVVLINYSIPSWLSIKMGHLLLVLLIPKKYKAKNMDVYLAPLVDELCILWNGVHAYDISRPIQQRNFVLRGILMWTMHDYPGLSESSGILLAFEGLAFGLSHIWFMNFSHIWFMNYAGLTTSGYNACYIFGPLLEGQLSTNMLRWSMKIIVSTYRLIILFEG